MVEDNPGDILLTREAFADTKVKVNLRAVRGGEEAIEYLGACGHDELRARPDLLLLDLHLPRRDGHELLRFVKGTPHLATIPVVVLSSLQAEADIVDSYRPQASCYITKPVDFERYVAVVRATEQFWLTTARLPGGVIERAARGGGPDTR